jgi:hypothetical protein
MKSDNGCDRQETSAFVWGSVKRPPSNSMHRTFSYHNVCVSVKLVANVTRYSIPLSYRGKLIFIIPPQQYKKDDNNKNNDKKNVAAV